MRPAPLLVAVVLGGCTTNNPFFAVNQGSGATTGSSGEATSSAGDADSGGAGATGSVTTGEPVDPDTGAATTGGPSSTGAASSTGADTTGAVAATSTGADTTGDDGSSSASTGEGLVCGDGVKTGDEQCDDGNDEPADGCERNCRFMFAPVEHGLAVAPNDLAFADFDGDDVLDVAVGHAGAQQGDPDLTIGLGKEDGTFDWKTWNAAGLLGASVVLVGRFVGGDARPDVVLMPANGASTLMLWENESSPGQAVISGPSMIAGPPNTTYASARSVDVNGDQKQDLVFVSATTGKLYLHRNNGVGFSPALSWATAGKPVDLAVGPLLPGDTLVDVLVAHKDSADDVSAFKGDGKGAFAPAPALGFCDDGVVGLSAGDADLAGPLDVVVTCQTGGLLVLAGHDGVAAYQRALGPGLPAVVQAGLVDLYGDDDDADVFAVAAASKQLVIGVQVAGKFAPSFEVALEHTPRRIAVGDLNDDDAPDLMLVFPSAARALVLLNQTRMAAPDPG